MGNRPTFTKVELMRAADVALEKGVGVRLEADRSITIIPGIKSINIDRTDEEGGSALRAWRENRRANKSRTTKV